MLKETLNSHLIEIDNFEIFNDNYDNFFKQRIAAISNKLKEKIIIQTIDKIDEILSTSDPHTISSLIEKFKLMKSDNSSNITSVEEISKDKDFSIDKTDSGKIIVDDDSGLIQNDIQVESITVTKNKSTSKFFIYIEGDINGNDSVINPVGKRIPFDTELFEDPEDIALKKLVSECLISEEQLKEYKKIKKIESYLDNVENNESNIKLSNIVGNFSFDFQINKSFIEDGKITILREYNKFLVGILAKNAKRNVSITSINGATIDAYLYYGESGWGEYFQLWMKDKPKFVKEGGFDKMRIGETIKIIFDGDIHTPKFIFR
jgi:hypothetical protein